MVSYLDTVFLMNVLWRVWRVNKKYEFTKPLHDQQPIFAPCQYINKTCPSADQNISLTFDDQDNSWFFFNFFYAWLLTFFPWNNKNQSLTRSDCQIGLNMQTVDAQKVVHCSLVKFVIVEEWVVSATSQADVSKLPLYDG